MQSTYKVTVNLEWTSNCNARCIMCPQEMIEHPQLMLVHDVTELDKDYGHCLDAVPRREAPTIGVAKLHSNAELINITL